MPNLSEAQHHDRLVAVVQGAEWLMSALRAARKLGLSSWCIGAGTVRNLVWDLLHEFNAPSLPTDIDLIYFDALNLTLERDAELQQQLAETLPNLPWEVTNQAAVHLWYEHSFGQAVRPLRSLEEGVASWPEYATAVGIVLREDNSIRVIAPHGLHDLFAGIVRHNPTRASIGMYSERFSKKRFSERWPNLKIVTAEAGD